MIVPLFPDKLNSFLNLLIRKSFDFMKFTKMRKIFILLLSNNTFIVSFCEGGDLYDYLNEYGTQTE